MRLTSICLLTACSAAASRGGGDTDASPASLTDTAHVETDLGQAVPALPASVDDLRAVDDTRCVTWWRCADASTAHLAVREQLEEYAVRGYYAEGGDRVAIHHGNDAGPGAWWPRVVSHCPAPTDVGFARGCVAPWQARSAEQTHEAEVRALDDRVPRVTATRWSDVVAASEARCLGTGTCRVDGVEHHVVAVPRGDRWTGFVEVWTDAGRTALGEWSGSTWQWYGVAAPECVAATLSLSPTCGLPPP